MDVFLQSAILGGVILLIIAEFYKSKFERSPESKDERGSEIIFKAKSISYNILSGGIILAVILVGALKVLPYGGFIFIVMIAYAVQSIVSSVFLYQARKI